MSSQALILPRRLAALVMAVLLAAGCDGAAPDDPAALATVAASGATHPTVAVNAATGTAYVAWVGRDGDAHNVYLAVAEGAGRTFSAPIRVNDLDGDAAPHEQAPAQVAVGPGGEVYVVWQNNTLIEGRRFPASDLRLAVSTDGGATFGPAIFVNDDAGGIPSSHTFQNLAVGPDGTVYVSWIDSRGQEPVGETTAGAAGAHAAMSTHGGPEIRVARSIDGGRTFSPSIVVDADSCPCCRTALVAGADGTVHVAWRKVFPGEVRDIVVATAAPGTLDFGEPVRVHPDDWVFPGCPHAGPALAVDDDGRLHVAWYTGLEGRQGLWYSTSTNARDFEPPIALLTGEWVPPSLVTLARSPSGMLAAWDDRTGDPSTIVLARLGADGEFAPTRHPSMRGRAPAFDASPSGTLLVWLDGEAIRAYRPPGGRGAR